MDYNNLEHLNPKVGLLLFIRVQRTIVPLHAINRIRWRNKLVFLAFIYNLELICFKRAI